MRVYSCAGNGRVQSRKESTHDPHDLLLAASLLTLGATLAFAAPRSQADPLDEGELAKYGTAKGHDHTKFGKIVVNSSPTSRRCT